MSKIHIALCRNSLIALALAASGIASGQTVVTPDSSIARPQVVRKAGSTNSCGVEMVGGKVLDEKHWEIVEFSFGVWLADDAKSTYGVAKAGFTKGTLVGNSRKEVKQDITDFYISTFNGSTVASPGTLVPAENVGYVIGAVDATMAVDLIGAAIKGTPLQFGASLKGQRTTNVYSFRSLLDEDTKQILVGCMTGITKELRANAAEKPTDN